MRRWWRTISNARRRPVAESLTPLWRSYLTMGRVWPARRWSMLVTEAGAMPRRSAICLLPTRWSSAPPRAKMAFR